MNEKEFHPYQDPIEQGKNILLVKPSKDYDASKDLKVLILDKREVAFTWPKPDIDLMTEVKIYGAKVVLQIGNPCTRKLPFLDLSSVGSVNEIELWQERCYNAVTDKIINYHHHDEYSMRDAIGTTKQLSVLLQAQGRKFMSVTNHGNIGGWIKQGNVCRDADIKCIYGMEAYYNNYRGDDPEKKIENRSANHLVLIAQNLEGYYNIIQIHNDAQLNGFYYTPRTCDESLQKYGKGIIATSACAAGELARLVMADKWEEAEARYQFYKSCFDKFYIEIQLIEMEEQKEINRRLIQLSDRVGGEITIGLDSHYLYPEHSETHDVLMCIRQKRTVHDLEKEDDDTWKFTVKNLYYRNYEQVLDLYENGYINPKGIKVSPFKDEVFTPEVFKKACINTRKIACLAEDIKLDTSIKLPKLYEDSEEVLSKMAWAGFNDKGFDKLDDKNKKIYSDRLSYELDVICLSGWADYFLITKMIIDKAVELKGEFATGAGRGSAAGSLVSFCIGITHIDPIKYDLLFERFLDFSRSEIKVNTFEV